MIHGGDGKNLLKHKVAWAEEWLKRRDDREPAAMRKNLLPIYAASNKLSNCQLKEWIENQKEQLKKLEIKIQNRQLKMLEKDKVNKIDEMNLMGRDKVNKIVGMDCEMVHADVGDNRKSRILARVSIVNQQGEVLYDTFVAPTGLVTDYVTEVSGVRPQDLENAPNFSEVRAKVAEIIKDCILVGHGLHHDLGVLYLHHPFKLKRDTSLYKPFRAACNKGHTPGLKALAEKYLGEVIQTGEHSSVEDSQVPTEEYSTQ